MRNYADELGSEFVARVDPTPLPDPYLIAFNPDVAPLVGLAPGEAARPEFVRLAAGNARFRGAEPFAALYAGHQFGTFVPQLGDGRAITLGEFENGAGARYEWQLKGAGTTAFSRFGDGRAVLRSTIREYLASEALAALGVPTTRALAIAGSDEPVFREKVETAAVLSRVAPSHVRFGSFEAFHYRGKFESVALLADYTIARFFPELENAAKDERYARFLQAVVERTGRLFARWQAAGFAHGVLNTDNMSILGLTLDYGPYGFLDEYDPHSFATIAIRRGATRSSGRPRSGFGTATPSQPRLARSSRGPRQRASWPRTSPPSAVCCWSCSEPSSDWPRRATRTRSFWRKASMRWPRARSTIRFFSGACRP